MVDGDVANHGGVVHLALLGQAQVEPCVRDGLVQTEVLVVVVAQLRVVRRNRLFETFFAPFAATLEKVIEIAWFLLEVLGYFLGQNTRLRLAV